VSLIAVHPHELAQGKALPWALYDQDHALLRAQGERIGDDADLRTLLEIGPMRDADAGAAQSASASIELTRSPDGVDGSEAPGAPVAPQTGFTFYDMNLKAGDRIQLAPPASIGADRHIVKLIGYLDPVSILVTTPVVNNVPVPLLKDDEIVARIFSGKNAFGFACSVTRVCKLPFEYLHLSFPQEIQGAVIRKSPRIRLRIIATITSPDNPAAEPASGMIVNISSSGALVDARKPLGEKGRKLHLTFRVNLHNLDVLLQTDAVIRSVFTDADAGGAKALHHGIEFEALQPNDAMLLHSLIYQHMVDHPHNVI